MPIVRSIPSEKIVNGNLIKTSQNVIISESSYKTKGEDFIVVKNIDNSKIVLDSVTTDHVTIKALTKVLIIPDSGKIDEEFDEVFIDKGTCIELSYCGGCWYIMSSDGLKLN
jgi:hypothetical protein